MKKILNLIFGKTVEEQEESYIKKHGYPEETKVFVDYRGQMSQIIGTNCILKNLELSKKIFAKKK